MKRAFSVSVLLSLFLSGFALDNNSKTHLIYVAVDGDNNNPGTEDMPLATMHRAMEIARERQAGDLPAPIEVIVGGGTYYFASTLSFKPEDSGSLIYPITYRAADNEHVVIRGGQKVEGWKEWRNGIYKTNLNEQGLGKAKFHQLFYKRFSSRELTSKRQILVRFPNLDPKHPKTGGYLYTRDQAIEGHRQLLYNEDDIPWKKWENISQAEIVSAYGGWYFATTPIGSVDQDENIINFKPIRRPIERINRFLIQNVFGALDSPGEWFLDYKTGDLYFYPPDGDLENGEVIVPTLDNVIEFTGTIPYPHQFLSIRYKGYVEDCPVNEVEMDPVSHITLKGFTIECAEQDAIRMTGTKACKIVSCRITNVGNIGVNIGGITSAYEEVGNPRISEAIGYAKVGGGAGGQSLWSNDPGKNCKVIGCDIWDIGCEGIMLLGSDNVAENNHIYDIGLYAKDCPGINLLGERNIAQHNTIHDLPRCAIFFKGMENVMEFNDIHHVVMETKDMGAIRSVHRNKYLGGDIIRYNRITDVPGYGFMAGQLRPNTFMTYGIYLDDYTSNVKIYGNIIANIGRSGIMVHGGNNVLFTNNIVYNPVGFPTEFSPIHPKNTKVPGTVPENIALFRNNITRNNILVSSMDITVPYRFARVEFWGKHKAYFSNNLIYNLKDPDNPMAVVISGRKGIDWEQWEKFGMEDGSVFGDPMFEDVNNREFRLKKESPAWALGFKEIPVEKIGCYESSERASWPIGPNLDRFREEGVVVAVVGEPKPSELIKFRMEVINENDISEIGW